MQELPLYRSHKTVQAIKIAALITKEDGTVWLQPEGDEYETFPLSSTYVTKHSPQPGGYYVRYPDGYESWSPATAFEDGYHLIGKASQQVSPDDDGPIEIRIAVDTEANILRMHFGKPCVWVGMRKHHATALADMLNKHAVKLA